MKFKRFIMVSILMLAVAMNAQAQIMPAHQTSNAWFTDAQAQLTKKLARTSSDKAQNVILFVGDGMGISTLTAARILQGQMEGNNGEEGYLSFEKFPYTALVKTYNVDAQTPDSAGTMTAMMSGIKTDVGVIGVDEDIVRGDCSTVKGNEVVTALELAEMAGLSTGIVSTARITHATPAATFAKSADRNWEDNSDMPSTASACEDIASQLINFEANLEARFNGVDVNGIEVAMGGGRRHFLPKDVAFNVEKAAADGAEGDRTDERNLTLEWSAQYPNGVYVTDSVGFSAIDTESVERVLGLFNESHMRYEADRSKDVAGEPSIAEMTQTAIEILDNNTKGYLLVVESGRIDHGHHAGSAYNALTDTIAFAQAVQAAVDTASDDTLILVTADHGHVFTIAGYPKRGNPILGKVVSVGQTEPATAADGLPYTTLGYTNGLGFRDLGDETDADVSYALPNANGRIDITGVNTQSSGYHQEALIPLSSETHAGEDITVHAIGPGAHKAQGVIEQNVVFHVMQQALDLNEQ